MHWSGHSGVDQYGQAVYQQGIGRRRSPDRTPALLQGCTARDTLWKEAGVKSSLKYRWTTKSNITYCLVTRAGPDFGLGIAPEIETLFNLIPAAQLQIVYQISETLLASFQCVSAQRVCAALCVGALQGHGVCTVVCTERVVILSAWRMRWSHSQLNMLVSEVPSWIVLEH